MLLTGTKRTLVAVFLVATMLAAGLAVGGEDRPGVEVDAVKALRLGLCTVRVTTDPLRFSWFYREELLFAQRYRRYDAALEFFDGAGWHGLRRLESVEREEAEELGQVRWRLTAAAAGGRRAVIRLAWSPTRGVGEFHCRLLEGEAKGWRQDLVPQADEIYCGPRIDRFSELRLAGGLEGAEGETYAILSSRGYGLLLDGLPRKVADAFFPDPDGLRLQVLGKALAYEVVSGPPRAVARALGELRSRRGYDERPEPVARRWEDVRGIVASRLVASPGSGLFSCVALPLREWLQVAPDDSAPEVRRLVPLCLEYPREAAAWRAVGTWLLGSDLLVTPNPTSELDKRDLYLPPGRWIALDRVGLEAEPIQGPALVSVALASGECAVFVRAASEAGRVLDK